MSKQLELEFYANMHNLAYIIRYPNLPRLHNESVAEHSFFVASKVIELANSYVFDMQKAVTIAIIHDWTESIVGDIPMNVRRNYRVINSAIEDAENSVAENYFRSDVCSLWTEHFIQQSVEAKIVMLADILQVLQYASNEYNLGNEHFGKVLVDVEYRINEIESELKQWKRKVAILA